ncbi:serine/threonine protein kinase [Rhodohalobacter sp. SW132]|uniref:serine/threonine-protein kinase n=1 Tax=Rhodohalobacter sp. SW132 TaxID=2293433 RepID=UPI000E242471|nr:serine/threonine-protein kinase [Rhodohalobacter sp. SW132]REL33787.1 serine/threonine protein kinase [Rhodohalobacter sp. SW132]
MKRSDWELIENIVDKALDLPVEQRRKFIAGRCKDKPVIKKEALELLESIEKGDLFPGDQTDPKFDLIQNMLDGLNHSELHQSLIGKKIGSYRLEKLIGSGGMGAVFLGERADGLFDHTVAVKIIRRDFTDESIRHHFDNERRILAKLTHEGIAQLYDGGVTDEGWPYLVMEYVNGIPIIQYCNENRLTIKQRLELFRAVCKAVHFAHSKLIIHRDLKPANILVKENNKIKILDFGIAQFLEDQNFAEPPRFLSPNYASPEQLTENLVSTASDIYSLGLLLHRLLGGFHPYEINGLDLSEQLEVIKENLSKKPSERLRKLPRENREEIAEQRKTSIRSLEKSMSGDLDSILQKSLKFNSDQRYVSAGDLQNDIDNFIQNLPVSTLADNKFYRFSKLLKRNRITFGSIAIILFMITGFALFHTNQIATERTQAQLEADKAEEITSFLIELFDSSNPTYAPGEVITAEDLLEQGLERADQISELPVKSDILTTIGKAYTRLGEYDTGSEIFQQAIDLNQSIYGQESVETADVIFHLGLNYAATYNWDLSLPYLKKAYEIYTDHLEPDHSNVVKSALRLATTMRHTGQPDSALKLADSHFEAIEHDYTEHDSELLSALFQYAYVLRGAGEIDRSEAIYLDLIERYEQSNDTLNNSMAANHNNLGSIYIEKEKYHKSEQHYRKSLDITNYIYGPDHPLTLRVRANMIYPVSKLGRYEEVATIIQEIITLTKDRYGWEHWRTGAAIGRFGHFSLHRKDYANADSLFQETHSIYKSVLGPDHFWTARMEGYLTLTNRLLGNHETADSLYKHHMAVLNDQQSNFSDSQIGRLQSLIDAFKEADGDFNEEISNYQSLLPEGNGQ